MKKKYILLPSIILSIILLNSSITISAANTSETLGVDNIDSIPITTDFIPHSNEHRPMISMDKPSYITIHNTANEDIGANARMHSNYLHYGNEPVSWHFTVDNNEIIQHVPLNEISYHAGDGSRGPGNLNSIAIEICENADGDYAKAEKNTVKLVAELLYKYDMSVSQVVKHQHWIDKECPHNMINKTKGSLGWEGFLEAVDEELTSKILEETNEENTEKMKLKVGQTTKLSLYNKAVNEEYKLKKTGYKLSINKRGDKKYVHKLTPDKNTNYEYSTDVLLSFSNYEIDNPTIEFNSLLKNKENELKIIGEKIVDKDSRTNISTGIAHLTFTSEKGKASFYVYNYISEQPVIASNIETLIVTGSPMELLTTKDESIKWTVKDESIASVKNGEIIGKKSGETIIYANIGNVTISRNVIVQ